MPRHPAAVSMRPPLHLPFCVVTTFLIYETAFTEASCHVIYNHNSTCVGFNALPACFGMPLPTEELTGYLTEVTPPDGCDPIESPPPSSNSSETFIALIRRAECPFGVKVLHAQQAGYHAAVVHNVNSEELVNMLTDDKEIQQQVVIPSVFVGQSAYLYLRRALRYEKGTHVTLVASKPRLNSCQNRDKLLESFRQFWPVLFSYLSHHITSYVIQEFGFMINVLICTIPLVVCARWYKKAQKITTHTFKRGDRYETCVICMAEYEEGDHLKILPCSHAYHCACIDTWLHTQPRNKSCPFCKQQVTIEAQYIHLDRGRGPQEQAREEEGNHEEEEPNNEGGGTEERHEEEYVERHPGDDQDADEEEWYAEPDNNAH